MRQQHLPDGVVELFIDAMLHCPAGCAPHPVVVVAELQVGGSQGAGLVTCAATAYVGAAGQVVVPLQVRRHTLHMIRPAPMFPSLFQRWHWCGGHYLRSIAANSQCQCVCVEET